MRRAALSLAFLLAASAPAQAAPEAGRLALAHRYMEAAHLGKTVDQTMAAVLPTALEGLPMGTVEEKARRQAILEVTTEVTGDMVRKLAVQLEPVIAETYSTEELTAMVGFYESPIGQSVIAKQPVLAANMSPILRSLMPEMAKATREKLCARLGCPPPKAP